MSYGAADSADQPVARRAAALIDPEGRIAEWHARVDARKYPDEQLARLRASASERPPST